MVLYFISTLTQLNPILLSHAFVLASNDVFMGVSIVRDVHIHMNFLSFNWVYFRPSGGAHPMDLLNFKMSLFMCNVLVTHVDCIEDHLKGTEDET